MRLLLKSAVILVLLLCCSLVQILLYCTRSASAEDAPLTMMAINVGKGDAILLQQGEARYLIDTGKAEHWGELSRALHALNVTSLDGVFLTHKHGDHAGGLVALAQTNIQIKAWYAAALSKESNHPLLEAAKLCHMDVTWLSAGDVLPLPNGEIQVLAPMQLAEKENNMSLVLRAVSPEGAILLTGDLEFPGEDILLDTGVNIQAEVLKVGNHGEDDATSPEFVQAVMPSVAVISTSTKEEPDTPSRAALRALKAFHSKVFVTQQGTAGILVRLQPGEVQAEIMNYKSFPDPATGIRITDKSVAQDAVTVANQGDTLVDLQGWFIYSTQGKEIFVFPKDSVLQPGSFFTVTSLASEDQGDYTWPSGRVWHKKKDDITQLYDPYGRLMDELE